MLNVERKKKKKSSLLLSTVFFACFFSGSSKSGVGIKVKRKQMVKSKQIAGGIKINK